MKTFFELRNEAREVWDKPNPVKNHSKLSPEDKARARARADRSPDDRGQRARPAHRGRPRSAR